MSIRSCYKIYETTESMHGINMSFQIKTSRSTSLHYKTWLKAVCKNIYNALPLFISLGCIFFWKVKFVILRNELVGLKPYTNVALLVDLHSIDVKYGSNFVIINNEDSKRQIRGQKHTSKVRMDFTYKTFSWMLSWWMHGVHFPDPLTKT